MAYLLAGLPLGVLWFSWSVTMYVTGAALAIFWVGVPILAFAQLSMRGIGAVERQHANQLLGSRIEAPGPVKPRPAADPGQNGWMRAVNWMGARMHDAHAWRVFTWTIFRGVMGPVGFVLAIVALVLPGTVLLAAIVYTLISIDGQPSWGSNWLYLAYPLSGLLLVPAAWLVRGVAAVHVPLARWALGPCESERIERATVRAERAEERVRIDQELHDSIGHMITMTVIQAGAGAHVFDTDPEFARQALRNIEQRGRAAMGELDRIIAAIRGDEPELRSPLPGMADLPALIGGSRAAGMTSMQSSTRPKRPEPLDAPRLPWCARRVTNAAKHAPGAPVSVTVDD